MLGCDLKTPNRFSFCLLAVLIASLWGCQKQLSEPPSGDAEIQNVGKWYQDFRSANGRRHPRNEAEFVAFIANRSKQEGTPVDPQEILKSPRDGQKYVVTYGKPTSSDFNRSVVAYEKEGVDGEKLVVFESKATRKMDDAELKALLSGK
jgi:hypothetical protein